MRFSDTFFVPLGPRTRARADFLAAIRLQPECGHSFFTLTAVKELGPWLRPLPATTEMRPGRRGAPRCRPDRPGPPKALLVSVCSRWVCIGSPSLGSLPPAPFSFGNPADPFAILCWGPRWLCVPALRRICLYREAAICDPSITSTPHGPTQGGSLPSSNGRPLPRRGCLRGVVQRLSTRPGSDSGNSVAAGRAFRLHAPTLPAGDVAQPDQRVASEQPQQRRGRSARPRCRRPAGPARASRSRARSET